MPHDPNYVPTQFTQKDYRQLYRMAKSRYLKMILHGASCRDKKVQNSFDRGMNKILKCSLNQLMLYVNEDTDGEQDILKWRLTIGK